MLSENLVMLRNLKGLTQEQVAEVVMKKSGIPKWLRHRKESFYGER